MNNKKRKVDSGVGISADLLVDDLQFKTQNDAPINASLLIDPTSHDLLGTSAGSNEKVLGVPPGAVDLQTVSGLESVLNSVSSSDAATTPEGVITDASFDSPFDHSTSSHPGKFIPWQLILLVPGKQGEASLLPSSLYFFRCRIFR